jgi:hypothetical protein
MNWYKNHIVYEFVLHNLYQLYEFVCMNSYKKLVKKKKPGWDFQPGTNMACNRRRLCHPPPRHRH